jgi:chaperonin cofactor prefoldin
MAMNELQRAVLETTATRDQAEALLQGLERAKEECRAIREKDGRADLMAQVRGASSLDDAIESTKRMIAALDRAVKQGRERLRARGEEPLDCNNAVVDRGANGVIIANGHAVGPGRAD